MSATPRFCLWLKQLITGGGLLQHASSFSVVLANPLSGGFVCFLGVKMFFTGSKLSFF